MTASVCAKNTNFGNYQKIIMLLTLIFFFDLPLNMTSPDLSVGLQSLLQSKETSRDDIFSQVSSPRKSKKKAKRSKIKRKKLFSFFGGTKTNQTPVDFQLSSPSNFRQAGHIDFDEETGEFNVGFFFIFFIFFFCYFLIFFIIMM